MRIDPAIAALRRDRALQRRAQAAMAGAGEAWRALPHTHQVLADFERYARGAALPSCPALAAMFAAGDSAHALITALVGELCRALATQPLGHPPFRHGSDRGTSTLLLAREGEAQLVLHACEPGTRRFDTAAFSDAERHEAILAGAARAQVVQRQGRFGRLAPRAMALRPGVRLALDLREQALQVLVVERRLVSLRLHRSAAEAAPSREYDLPTGALLRQSAGNIRVSRHEAMVALLGRMGRVDAAPAMATIARSRGDASLRWQALRECLALDTAAGFGVLCDLARAPDDPLAAPARALRGQLLADHPELAGAAGAPCLA